MGGRGSSSGVVTRPPALDLGKLTYNVISHDTPLRGATYPFLAQTGRAWHVLTRPVDEPAAYHPAHTFGLATPTLRWVSANSVTDVYVDGINTEQFLQATGLELHLDKGAYVLSKRLSRIMRPYLVSGHFEAADVQVAYLNLDEKEARVWDGAGLISRQMLHKISRPDGLNPAQQARLLRELESIRRVEFTLVTANGQDKGHAIVVDDLEVDFLLPQDTKGEARLTNGQTFVGINFVHGRDHMRLDIQSLINLYPFFNETQLLGWLRDEGELFVQSIESGTVAEMMGRLDNHTTLADITGWHVREYLVSGGHPTWFGSHVKSLMNQHLERLNDSTLEKLRLPIPGGRYYVMPAGVGQPAGLSLSVPRGHIHIDKKHGTAWVNDEDWLALPDSPQGEGIAGILGGADNDDALWLYPFTDHDGHPKVLAWRSPNQVGEYVLLKPTAESYSLAWTTAASEAITYPAGDSRRLAPRIDHTNPVYLSLIDPATTGGLGEGQRYNVEIMDTAIERARINQGALGMYCNSLMVNKALYGRLPVNPPAPLEDIIDSSVKTGADLSQVIVWNYQNSGEILRSGIPIPAILHGRLSYDRRHPARPPVSSQYHWLDKTIQGVKAHIVYVQTRRDEMVKATMPPRELFDSAFEDPETIRMGAGLNQAYARTIKRLAQARPYKVLTPDDYEAARRVAEEYLTRYLPQRHTAILRGAMVSAYLGETPASGAAVWLPGEKTASGRQPGLAQRSLVALREIGLLDEIDQTAGGGVIVYPNAAPLRPSYKTIGIQGVWFHWYRADAHASGRPVPEQMADMPKAQAQWAKQRIEELAQSTFRQMTLYIREENGRQVAYTEDGSPFGILGRDSDRAAGSTITIQGSIARDGNLRVAIQSPL